MLEKAVGNAAGVGKHRLAVVLCLAGAWACSETGLGTSRVNELYEGENFFEPETPEPAAVPLQAPGFSGLVVPEQDPECVGGDTRTSLDSSDADPSLLCAPVVRPLISDFTHVPGSNPTGVIFGAESSVRGGTFFYPDAPDALSSDVSGDDWHLFGTVRDVSGFGLYFEGCQQIDASAYRGLAFRIWGQVGEGGSLVVFLGTATNQVASGWINQNKPTPEEPDVPDNLGRCVPLASRYDGSCAEPRAVLTVPSEPTEVVIPWGDLSGGCPEDDVVPSEVTAIGWYFTPSVDRSYSVDLHIDDLRFTNVDVL